MTSRRNHYQDLEKLLKTALLANAAVFVLYLIFAGIVWLKVIFALFAILIPLAGLALLFLSRELLRQRSLWLTTGFFSLLICTVVSLILAFP